MNSVCGKAPRAWMVSLVMAGALCAGAGSVAAAAPVEPAADSVSAHAVAVPRVNELYVAKVTKGTTQSLVVASRATGAVVRTVASGTVRDGMDVFGDVDLAPDGSVWAVLTSRAMYGDRLVKYAPGRRAVVVMPYVVAARVSPDGRRLAVTVISPDVDKDGLGTASVRVGPVGGGRFTTLGSSKFAVDRKTGDPTMEILAPRVAGWVGASSLVVEYGCCDDGNVSIISANTPSSMSRWKAFNGNGSTRAVGLLGRGRVLVLRDKEVGDGIKVPIQVVGLNAYSVGAVGKPRLLWSGRPKDDSERTWLRLADAAVKATKATPLAVSRVRYPFRGQGFVTEAFV